MESWGRYPKSIQNENILYENISFLPDHKFLVQGLARSYGDSCLSESGNLLITKKLDNLISFDSGILECEAGVSIYQLNNLLIPRGWFIPVTPGTQFVTLGGAIANDVHGKNHHIGGTIGRYIKSLELVRSDGVHQITPENPLFNATIGGLGLTGYIRTLKIELKKIPSRFMEVELVPFKDIDEFFKISEDSKQYEYTASWLDCLSLENRGIFFRGNHTDRIGKRKINIPLTVPFDLPSFTLNKLSIKAFNSVFYNINSHKGSFIQDLIPFFYPLDSVNYWNKIYGKRGFLQFQCIIPKDVSLAKKLLGIINESKKASFLTVFKEFGDIKSPGILSFPKPGMTLALDFPADTKGIELVKKLNEFTCNNAGCLYPAKDALMTKEQFDFCYPQNEQFLRFIDPKIDSKFAKRVGLI